MSFIKNQLEKLYTFYNLDVIKCCDHLIDLGPEGGVGGGTILDECTPEKLIENPQSYTGKFLKKLL